MSTFDWSSFLLSQLWLLPSFMVYFVGIILAFVFWPRHPAVSVLCLIAFVILLANLALGSGLQLWQMSASDRGVSFSQIGRVYGIAAAVRVLFGTIAWTLLLTAMFGWRFAPNTRDKILANAGKPTV